MAAIAARSSIMRPIRPDHDDSVAGFAPLDLYQRREKIFTRSIEGRFQRLRAVFRMAAAARLSAAAVARLGRPAGGAVRSAARDILRLRR